VAETALRQDPSVLEVEEVAEALAVDLDSGLSSAEAARRLAADGPNELRGTPPVPIWRKILAQFQDPLIYLLLAAVVISLVAWVLGGRIGWPVDAIVIAVVVILNAALGYVQEARAESAVAALQEMTAVTSAVLRDGQLARIPSDQLVRGDLIVLAEGDAVGADARLTEAAALRVLEASLTGESEAVEKNVSALPGPAALGDRHCMVYKGTAVAQGSGRAIVTATGMATEMGSIAGMLEETQEEPTPLQTEVGRIGRMLGIAVIIIAFVVVVTVFVISDVRTVADAVTILLLGVSLAVAAVRRGCPRSCRSYWRSAYSEWPSTGPLSRSCPLWRRWALPR
jgi:Ca2+-transporting ATPase